MVTEVPPELLMQRLQEFTKLWQKFMNLFDKALESSEILAEEEKDFRRLQSEVIRRSQFLTLAVPNKIFDLNKDIKKLLLESPSLLILKQEVPIRITALRNLWHDVSINLNQKQGQLRAYLEEHDQSKGRRKK